MTEVIPAIVPTGLPVIVITDQLKSYLSEKTVELFKEQFQHTVEADGLHATFLQYNCKHSLVDEKISEIDLKNFAGMINYCTDKGYIEIGVLSPSMMLELVGTDKRLLMFYPMTKQPADILKALKFEYKASGGLKDWMQ